MNTWGNRTRVSGFVAALLCIVVADAAEAGGRRIPYQGQLQGVSGNVTVSVELKDAPTGGVTVWGPETHAVTLDADGRFFVPIGDSERDVCRRVSNLVVNGDAEAALVAGELPGWTEVVGTSWTGFPAGGALTPFSGTYSLGPGSSSAIGVTSELAQTIDVSPFAAAIDAGTQRFRFTARGLQLADETLHAIVEYRSAANQILASYDSGEPPVDGVWQQFADERLAPAGTRFARVRLTGSRSLGILTDTYFDDVRLSPWPDVSCDRRDGVADLDQIDPHALYTEVTIDDGATQTVLFPRHRLEPAHHAASTSGDVAVGTVVLWWGTLANIPAGWELCDGGLPTTPGATLIVSKPDLRGRFARIAGGTVLDPTTSPVIGGNDTVPAGTSGSTTLSKAQMPNHTLPDTLTAGATIGGHSHQVSHACTVDGSDNGTETHYALGDNVNDIACPITIAAVGNHTHPLSPDRPQMGGSGQAHSHSVPARDNRPAYLDLFYIVRVK